ncbi:MAG: molybdenum cofactor guanylyltransferase [Lysobacter sp.]|nr:molybdenum cofactor guanylyltransferase [Lysobacter sp.]
MSPGDITLGLLAGGKASRLGGIDKAWLERDGMPQVLRWQRRFSGEAAALLVSANRDLDRYAAHGLAALPDRTPDAGPLGALDTLAAACTTPWLFTLPVDLIGTNDCLLRTLASQRGEDGAFAVDDDGAQPLVALWRCDALLVACKEALVANDCAIHALQSRLKMTRVVFSGFRFGNLNTPDDLHNAGIATDIPST